MVTFINHLLSYYSMAKKTKFRTIEDSELQITEKVDEGIDSNGRKWIKVQKRIASEPVSLGTAKKPNKKIVEIRYRVGDDDDQNPFKNVFKGLR